MVFKDGELELVTGSPGGSQIINIVVQMILDVLDFHMNVAEATEAVRIHHQWQPDELRVERGLSIDTVRLLEAMGYKVRVEPSMGSTQTIERDGGLLYGFADTRQRGTGRWGIRVPADFRLDGRALALFRAEKPANCPQSPAVRR